MKTQFWTQSAEGLQAAIKDALDTYAEAVKTAQACGSSWGKETALTRLIERCIILGFKEADALRWARARVRRP